MSKQQPPFVGHPMDFGWEPHKHETWTHPFARLKNPTVFRVHTFGSEIQTEEFLVPAGARVRIVMVSRFGDVGITDNMSAEHGYRARVLLSDLTDFQSTYDGEE